MEKYKQWIEETTEHYMRLCEKYRDEGQPPPKLGLIYESLKIAEELMKHIVDTIDEHETMYKQMLSNKKRSPDEQLVLGVNNSDVRMVVRALRHGADVNCMYGDMQIIYRAVEKHDTEIANILWSNGAVTTNDDNEILCYTCSGGTLELVKMLVEEFGADVNASDKGYTVLHAVTYNNTDDRDKIMEYILERFTGDINSLCEDRTAIYMAALHEQWKLVELLHAKGGVVNDNNRYYAKVLIEKVEKYMANCNDID